ncbi:hypothetical protein N7519_008952 [Penicillium mononematosum]|uniref:uncharacterized protein n=1 Tax=Penicillium mononematosum TaxID=268346 RepID=UPI00254982F3|nr:uncharacterized protein N7519_008952 [Penicillium mononematosum]KAJ6178491.1 hypothetical protein N7519_008952 [Penicillium mononematosum]
MLSPTFSYHSRMAPPVRPSRSLEGLERVIPPLSPNTPSTRCTRSELFLNKPLPARPLPDQPECSAMWSDSSDSDTESTLDSLTGPSEPRNSADSYPIFVSSGSDFDDLVDHPAPSADQLLRLSPQPPHKRTDSIGINIPSIVEPASVSVSSSFSDTQYVRPPHWNQNRTGTNHYFREKKWDYFPELAPSALQASGRISPNMVAPNHKTRKIGNPLDFAKGKYRWHSLDRGGFGGVRDSIKTYVHRTLSRDSTESKKEIPRPATAPMDRHLNDVGGTLGKTVPAQQSSLALDTKVARATSVPSSNAHLADFAYFAQNTHYTPPKQLAVPLSPYQKHGPVSWESPKKSKKRNIQFPRYKSSPVLDADPSSSSSSAPDLSYANATSSLSPSWKQSQHNTRGVFLGAKKKIVESKDNRRREHLKAQIKFVGPVNPHTYVQADPWV